MEIKEEKYDARRNSCYTCNKVCVKDSTNEMYCELADSREIWLIRGQHRPKWCPMRESEV